MTVKDCRIGIDLGGTRIKVGLIRNEKIIRLRLINVDSGKELRVYLTSIRDIIKEFLTEEFVAEGIGVTFAGMVNSADGKIADTSSKYEDAPLIDLNSWSESEFGLPLKIENDARAGCLAEWLYGAGRGTTNMIYLMLGTGVGTATVVDGKLLKGQHQLAGILGGHFIIDYKNKEDRCSCGKYGHVEGIASLWKINRMNEHLSSPNANDSPKKKIGWEEIVMLSDQGDVERRKLKEDCLKTWSIGLVNLVLAYDPEKVVIGGGISHNIEEIRPYFKGALENFGWYPSGAPVIEISRFPDTGPLLGAGALFEVEN